MRRPALTPADAATQTAPGPLDQARRVLGFLADQVVRFGEPPELVALFEVYEAHVDRLEAADDARARARALAARRRPAQTERSPRCSTTPTAVVPSRQRRGACRG